MNKPKIIKCPDYDPGERTPKSKSKFYGIANIQKIAKNKKPSKQFHKKTFKNK